MNDKKLMRLALAASIIGLTAIYVTTLFIGPAEMEIGRISEDDAGRHVKLNATVISTRTSDGNVFLKISDGSGDITAVIFERTARTINRLVVEGDHITVTGQVNVYKGELEIIVEKLWK